MRHFVCGWWKPTPKKKGRRQGKPANEHEKPRFEGTGHHCGRKGHRKADCWYAEGASSSSGGRPAHKDKGKGKSRHKGRIQAVTWDEAGEPPQQGAADAAPPGLTGFLYSVGSSQDEDPGLVFSIAAATEPEENEAPDSPCWT